MAACRLDGDPAMYGLGIRLGFYLAWGSDILTPWLARTEVPVHKLLYLLFSAAGFLALIIQTSLSAHVRAVDVYLTLLLVAGLHYTYVPLYIWRLVTGFNPFVDPARWPRVTMGPVFDSFHFCLVLAVSIFQLWFWTTGIKGVPPPPGRSASCGELGFFFALVPLRSDLFVAFNVIVSLGILVGCFLVICFRTGLVRPPRSLRRQIEKAEDRGVSPERSFNLQQLHTFFKIVVVAIVIPAIELTIGWNNLTGVDNATTVAQTIPATVFAALLAHAFYVRYLESVGVSPIGRLMARVQWVDDGTSSTGSSRSSSSGSRNKSSG